AEGLPDLDNRAPSLVAYVADAIEPAVLGMLSEFCASGAGEHISSDGLRGIHSLRHKTRWLRSWYIANQTGVLVQVAVQIDEATDPLVSITVDRAVVASGVPPWIRARTTGNEDAKGELANAAFFQAFVQAARAAVEREHVAAARRPGTPE